MNWSISASGGCGGTHGACDEERKRDERDGSIHDVIFMSNEHARFQPRVSESANVANDVAEAELHQKPQSFDQCRWSAPSQKRLGFRRHVAFEYSPASRVSPRAENRASL